MLSPNDLRIPRGWEIIAGADTGTYLGGVICAINPAHHCYVLEEFANYRYTGDGTIEETGETVSEWIDHFSARLRYWTKQRRNSAWVDANTTFKTEVKPGFRFRMNRKDLELRTEITREYVRRGRLHLMPWLEILPYEMEEAVFPDHESIGTGKKRRIKHKDHVLDGVEHVCSRRPHPQFTLVEAGAKPGSLQEMMRRAAAENMRPKVYDEHLGAN